MQPHSTALGVDGDGDRVMLRLGGLAVPLPWLQSFAPVLQPQVPSLDLGEETVMFLGQMVTGKQGLPPEKIRTYLTLLETLKRRRQ